MGRAPGDSDRSNLAASWVWTAGAAGAGAALGLFAAFATGNLSRAEAAHLYAARLDLRDAPLTSADAATGPRADLIAQILAGEALPAEAVPAPPARPKLFIIFDDMGVDRAAFARVIELPGPLTLSFLPYAPDLDAQAAAARAAGDDVLLHLPMEPRGGADPGPRSLRLDMGAERLFETLAFNLEQFDGYVGVNNHMGSRFTRDEAAMKRVLAMLRDRGLFFIDSLTTGDSAALSAGAAVGAEVFVRDVFLDAEPGGEAVRRQLALAEEIAARTGYAIVICHPRAETIAAVGPWLTTALARGFELAGASSLRAAQAKTAAL